MAESKAAMKARAQRMLDEADRIEAEARVVAERHREKAIARVMGMGFDRERAIAMLRAACGETEAGNA